MLETLIALVQPWADLFSNDPALSTAVIAVHVLAMFVAGGMAIGTDRAILRAPIGSSDAARAVVADLSTMHNVVLVALTVTVASGIALFTSDLATYAVSKVYWTKMATVSALLVNGLRMRRAEDAVLRPLANVPLYTAEISVAFPVKAWHAVRRSAAVSLTLWCIIVLLGVVLANV